MVVVVDLKAKLLMVDELNKVVLNATIGSMPGRMLRSFLIAGLCLLCISFTWSTCKFILRFDICSDVFLDLFLVYTPIGDSILAKRVYRTYSVSVLHKLILCDLIELNMSDIDIILGIDWLHTSCASIDYRAHRVKFQFHNDPILE